ncbi:MAG: hypothetical protein OXD47_02330, partial [Gammaproteobacteria bacterium]|nr:hypothetical protein [Gammaproteobacteria bacterium]MCY4337617.1 hypothetical protein [Gammaproteobacteria bacterium]
MGKKIRNWLRGAATTVELWPDTSSRLKQEFLNRSDKEALFQDWQRVGNDIRTAMGKHEQGCSA